MSSWKSSIIVLLILSVVAAPLSSVSAAGPCDKLTGSALSQCQNAQAAAPTIKRFNPNVNISSGNTYGSGGLGGTGGLSISGVGGAIASCTNAGAFLVNTASEFLSSKVFTSNSKSISNFVGGGDAVSVSDKKAQDKLASIDKTNKCLDGIAYAVAKNTLAQVTNKTLNWVNTGLNGNPLYVQNMNSYLVTIARQDIKNYLQTVQVSDPIFGNALESSIRTSVTGQSDGLLNVPLDTPESHAYNSFLTDFTNGGWNSFLNPKNNSVGALFTATDTLKTKISSSQEDAKQEVQRGSGFLDLKHCVQYAAVDTSTTSKAIANGLSQNPACIQWATDTPGSIIASQVQAITTSPIRQLEYADKINEVLGGFFDGFVNNLLQQGLRGSGSTGDTINFGFSSAGDNVVLDSSGNTLNANGDLLGYQSTGSGSTLGQNFDISRPQQFDAVLQTQYNYLNRAEDAKIALDRIVPTVGALDYCIPGPNPQWQSSLSSNFSSFVSSLQQASKDSPSTIDKVISAIPVLGGLFNAFFGSNDPPQIWSTPGLLNDPVTGLSVQVPRTFYNSSTNFKGGQSTLNNGLTAAYQEIINRYSYYASNTQVESAFTLAAAGDSDPSYVAFFLRESESETASLISYNQAASNIDAQYDTNIGQTQSNIDQMVLIRKQINDIVATAKAAYIKNRAAAGNPVDIQCLDNAYAINNSTITPTVTRQESDASQDPMIQHSAASAAHFYNDIVK